MTISDHTPNPTRADPCPRAVPWSTGAGPCMTQRGPRRRGVPFAEPPVGDLRFAPPVLKTTWNASTFDATSYGPSCLLFGSVGMNPLVSEDCLSVNIFRPASNGLVISRLPVQVYVYGSGFAGMFVCSLNEYAN